jgi:hypothetical protein
VILINVLMCVIGGAQNNKKKDKIEKSEKPVKSNGIRGLRGLM